MSGDIGLQKRILEELAWEPMVDASHIGVAAEDGVVTLSGHVSTYAEKFAAERAAKRIKGVHAIVEKIEVRLPSSDERSDEAIATSIVHSLQWRAGLPADQIQVKVERGYVTLTGKVDWRYQKDMAESGAFRTRGVRGVKNQISVRPSVQPFAVKQKIEEALKRSAELDAAQIVIVASGDAVTLSGRVRTWHERDAAVRAAWSAPGVAAVTDHLRIDA